MPQRMTRLLRANAFEGSYYDLGDCAQHVGSNNYLVTVFWDLGEFQRVTVTSNSNLLIYFENMVAGRRLVLVLEQDDTGGGRVTLWPWYVYWSGGTAPTLSTAPGAVDLIEFLCMGVRTVYGRLWGRCAGP